MENNPSWQWFKRNFGNIVLLIILVFVWYVGIEIVETLWEISVDTEMIKQELYRLN